MSSTSALQDIVIARPRDMDDHVTWLLQRHRFLQALQTAQEHAYVLLCLLVCAVAFDRPCLSGGTLSVLRSTAWQKSILICPMNREPTGY